MVTKETKNSLNDYYNRFSDEKCFESYYGFRPIILVSALSNGIWCVAHNAIDNGELDDKDIEEELSGPEFVAQFQVSLNDSLGTLDFRNLFHQKLTKEDEERFGIGRDICAYKDTWFLTREEAVKYAKQLHREHICDTFVELVDAILSKHSV